MALDRVLELAQCVSDGVTVDWTRETRATVASDAQILRNLKLLAQLADVHGAYWRSQARRASSRQAPAERDLRGSGEIGTSE
jgi:hypothetical protein